MGVLHSNEGIDFSRILHKELKVIGSLSQKPTAWHTAMNIIEDKKVNVKNLVSHIFSLDDWEEAFKTASGKEGLKVMFNPEL
jgi:L-iditol 2-dehydrogenase